jgi:hypothetical protein
LTDSRKINGWHLHPETLVVAAVNGGEHGAQYQVGEMDPAELDRWTVFDVEPSISMSSLRSRTGSSGQTIVSRLSFGTSLTTTVSTLSTRVTSSLTRSTLHVARGLASAALPSLLTSSLRMVAVTCSSTLLPPSSASRLLYPFATSLRSTSGR